LSREESIAGVEFYTGVVAEHYDLLVPEDETRSHPFFRSALEQDGQPALELACGTGRPLLSFVAAGLDVEGLDSSSDMLDRCRAKAASAGLEVVLHHQRMESFAIERRFRTIYCASSSFTLLEDDETARRSLAAIHRHLEPNGRILLALHLPGDFATMSRTEWRVAREAQRGDGATVRCLSKLLDVDGERRVYATSLRYEVVVDGAAVQREERTFRLHWYPREQLDALLGAAGYRDVQFVRGNGDLSPPTDRVFIVSARRG
jgi:SAM-dependent methyltransferase